MDNITYREVYDFFSTRFDMRKLPKGVKVVVEKGFYCFTIGLSEKITCVESFIGDNENLDESSKAILIETLKATPGLYELFESSVGSQADQLLAMMGEAPEVEGVVDPESSKNTKSKQNLLQQKTWRFFANEDSPIGVDTYIYMSSKIVKTEELAAEMFRITRDYYRVKGIEIPHKERMSIWTLKDFLDNHILESPEAELRLQASTAFEQALDRIRFWVDSAWDTIVNAQVQPLSEYPAEWLEDDRFFKEEDEFFTKIREEVTKISLLNQEFDQRAKELATVDLSNEVFNSYIGQLVVTNAQSDNASHVLEVLKEQVKALKEEIKDKAKITSLLQEVKAIENYCNEAIDMLIFQFRNEIYNPEPDDKDQLELDADAAMSEILSSWA